MRNVHTPTCMCTASLRVRKAIDMSDDRMGWSFDLEAKPTRGFPGCFDSRSGGLSFVLDTKPSGDRPGLSRRVRDGVVHFVRRSQSTRRNLPALTASFQTLNGARISRCWKNTGTLFLFAGG